MCRISTLKRTRLRAGACIGSPAHGAEDLIGVLSRNRLPFRSARVNRARAGVVRRQRIRQRAVAVQMRPKVAKPDAQVDIGLEQLVRCHARRDDACRRGKYLRQSDGASRARFRDNPLVAGEPHIRSTPGRRCMCGG